MSLTRFDLTRFGKLAGAINLDKEHSDHKDHLQMGFISRLSVNIYIQFSRFSFSSHSISFHFNILLAVTPIVFIRVITGGILHPLELRLRVAVSERHYQNYETVYTADPAEPEIRMVSNMKQPMSKWPM